MICIWIVLVVALFYSWRDMYRVKKFKNNAKNGDRCEFLRSGFKTKGFVIDYHRDNVFSMVKDENEFMARIPTVDVMPRNCFKFAFKPKPVL